MASPTRSGRDDIAIADTIGRLRRAQPRNADTNALCDWAEVTLRDLNVAARAATPPDPPNPPKKRKGTNAKD